MAGSRDHTNQCEGGIWASPETPMNTKQNVMHNVNDVPIIYQATIDFMHYNDYVMFVQLNVTLTVLKS